MNIVYLGAVTNSSTSIYSIANKADRVLETFQQIQVLDLEQLEILQVPDVDLFLDQIGDAEYALKDSGISEYTLEQLIDVLMEDRDNESVVREVATTYYPLREYLSYRAINWDSATQEERDEFHKNRRAAQTEIELKLGRLENVSSFLIGGDDYYTSDYKFYYKGEPLAINLDFFTQWAGYDS